jgi:hypothetical protein
MCCRPDGPAEITACAVAVLRARAIVYSDGNVRWCGVMHIGLPMALRVWGVMRGEWTWKAARRMPGCGCVAKLRRAWDRLTRWPRRLAHLLPGPSAAF